MSTSKNVPLGLQEVREDEVDIEGKRWDHPDVRRLWGRQMTIFDACRSYSEFYIQRGRKLQDYYNGKIFTDEQRAVLEDVEGKITVEPRVLKAPIRALVGQLIKARRSGQITTEAGTLSDPQELSKEIAVVNAVLKAVEQKTEEKYAVRDAMLESCVACYPVCLEFEKVGPGDGPCCGGHKLSVLPWDSVVYGPINYKNVGQIREKFRLEFRTKAELVENFPDLEDQIVDHFQMGNTLDANLLSSLEQWSGDASAEFRDQLYDIVKAGVTQVLQTTGLIPVIEHQFPIRRTEDVWVNMFDESQTDYKVKPESWGKDRWAQWLDGNKDRYEGPYRRPVHTLWSTVFTTTGLVLDNKKHWYQNSGALPSSIWVPAMSFGAPTGPSDDMADDVVANAVAETEYLHDIRTGTGKLIAFKEGSVKNAGDITSEASKSIGVIVMDKAVQAIQNDLMEITRTPNKAYKEYAEQRKASMAEVTRINETMQGAAAPRQAAIAKNLEIAQALIVNAIYIDSFNQQWEFHQNLKLSMFPYMFTSYEILQLIDEDTNEPMAVEVKAPVETGVDENNNVVVTKVANDITSRDYSWKVKPVDDSPTAKEQAMQEALVFINAASGPLIQADPSGKFFARVLLAMPNIFLNKAGKGLVKDAQDKAQSMSEQEKNDTMQKAQIALMKAQAEMEKAKKAGVAVTFAGTDLAQYPELVNILQNLRADQPIQPPTQPAAPQPPQAAVPSPQPVGAPA